MTLDIYLTIDDVINIVDSYQGMTLCPTLCERPLFNLIMLGTEEHSYLRLFVLYLILRNNVTSNVQTFERTWFVFVLGYTSAACVCTLIISF